MALSRTQARVFIVAVQLLLLALLIRRLATAWAADCEVTSLADGDCSLCQGGGDAVLGAGGTLTLLEETPVMEVGTIPNFLRRVYVTSHPVLTFPSAGHGNPNTIPFMNVWNSPSIDNTDIISGESGGVFTVATTGLYRVSLAARLTAVSSTHGRMAFFINYDGGSVTPCNLDYEGLSGVWPNVMGMLTGSCTKQLTSGTEISVRAYGTGTTMTAEVRALLIELL